MFRTTGTKIDYSSVQCSKKSLTAVIADFLSFNRSMENCCSSVKNCLVYLLHQMFCPSMASMHDKFLSPCKHKMIRIEALGISSDSHAILPLTLYTYWKTNVHATRRIFSVIPNLPSAGADASSISLWRSHRGIGAVFIDTDIANVIG